jgi:hypothetical protein
MSRHGSLNEPNVIVLPVLPAERHPKPTCRYWLLINRRFNANHTKSNHYYQTSDGCCGGFHCCDELLRQIMQVSNPCMYKVNVPEQYWAMSMTASLVTDVTRDDRPVRIGDC